MNLLHWAAIILMITIALIAVIFVIYDLSLKYIYKASTLKFEESISALLVIINSEIAEYETNIFKSGRPITNSNFENFYDDITSKTVDAVSPMLMNQLSAYITKETVYKYIGRKVRDYLVKKATDDIKKYE